MIWFLAPLVAVVGKAVYDAVTSDSEEDIRDRQRRHDRQEERERAQARQEELARQRTAKQDEIRADAHADLRRLMVEHKSLLAGTVPEPGDDRLTFDALQDFSQRKCGATDVSLLATLSLVVPTAALSTGQRSRDAQMQRLRAEIEAIETLRRALSEGTPA